MRNKIIYSTLLIGLIVILSVFVFISSDLGTMKVQGAEPILEEAYVYEDYDPDYGGWTVLFEITYRDPDGDEGDVTLLIDGGEFPMNTDLNMNPQTGRYFFIHMVPETIQDEDTFFFYAEDSNGDFTYLGDAENPFWIGDYMGWGEKPVLSNPEVYYNDGTKDYVFSITYQDVEGDVGYLAVNLFDDTDSKTFEMYSGEGNPIEGQTFEASVPESEIDDTWNFYFDAWDEAGSTTYLPDQSQDALLISDVIGTNGGDNGGGNGDGGGGIGLPKGWLDNPEVVVGIIGLVAIGAGSAYGVYRRKKKHGRFSELLTEMDLIYGSFKTNPKRCELELEKMRSTINEDLKKSTIDDNNYSILKGRIDEILGEIRSESIRSEVTELPKDIELKIKDMLIDGEITRAEYDKILPLIKGSDMATDDKEKTKKIVESWMKKEKDK
jgi:hypothetical protein